MAVGNTGEHLRIPGLVAGEDLNTKQYHIVRLAATTAKSVLVAGAGTVAVIGILQNDPKSGEAASVVCAGLTRSIAGGAINPGDMVTANSTGQCVATTTANNKVVGKAVTATTTAGDHFELIVGLGNY